MKYNYFRVYVNKEVQQITLAEAMDVLRISTRWCDTAILNELHKIAIRTPLGFYWSEEKC
jgi:hypothetical protein